MLSKTALKNKCDCYAPEKWYSGLIKEDIKVKFLSDNNDMIVVFNNIFNFKFNINCRKQIRFNRKNWWIMHMHHIGLPPTTDNYPVVPVFGNYLN